MKTTLGLAVLMLFSCAAVAAAPSSMRYERKATVYVADLDLGTERDARVLYERIGAAARALCMADELSFDVKKRRHHRECIEAAMSDAVERANSPLLTAIHMEQRERQARL